MSCCPESGAFLKTEVPGPLQWRKSKPEEVSASEADENTPDDFYFSFLTGLLPFSENLEMKRGI